MLDGCRGEVLMQKCDRGVTLLGCSSLLEGARVTYILNPARTNCAAGQGNHCHQGSHCRCLLDSEFCLATTTYVSAKDGSGMSALCISIEAPPFNASLDNHRIEVSDHFAAERPATGRSY
jgi:hypothetical protein